MSARASALQRLEEDFRIVRVTPSASKCSSQRSSSGRSDGQSSGMSWPRALASRDHTSMGPQGTQVSRASTGMSLSLAHLPETRVLDEEHDFLGSHCTSDLEHKVQQCMHELGTLRKNVMATQESVSEVALKQQRKSDDWIEIAGNVEMTVKDLRIEFDLRSTQYQGSLAALQALAEQNRIQITDLRGDLGALREQQEMLSSSAPASRGHEHVGTARSEPLGHNSVDFQRSLRAACTSTKEELKQEIEKVRTELEAERLQADEHAAQVSQVEARVKEQTIMLDDMNRKLGEARQDQLSETTLLRGRLEAAVGEREQYLSQTEGLQRLVTEEKCRQSVQVAKVFARLDVLESQFRELSGKAQVPQDLTALLTRLSAVEQGLAELPTAQALHARLESLQAGVVELRKCPAAAQVPCTADRGAPSGGPAAPADAVPLWTALEAVRADIEQLNRDLGDERRERYKAFADVGRFTEDVAKVAAATIGRAEKRFAEEFATSRQVPPRPTDTTAIGSDVARLVGEMDAELRVELTSRVKMLIAEVRGEIISDVAARVASTDARVSAIEASWDTQLLRTAGDLRERISKLEAVQLDPRVGSVEEEGRDKLLAFSTLQASTSNSSALQAKPHRLQSSATCEAEAAKAETLTPRRAETTHSSHSPTRDVSITSTSRRDASRQRQTKALGRAEADAHAKPGPALPESLKESLEGVVKAVHKTLNHSQSPSEQSSVVHATRHAVSDPTQMPKGMRTVKLVSEEQDNRPSPGKQAESDAPGRLTPCQTALPRTQGRLLGAAAIPAASGNSTIAQGVTRPVGGSQAQMAHGCPASLLSSRLATRSSSPGFVPCSPQVVSQANRQQLQQRPSLIR